MSYITKLPFEGKMKITYPYGVKDNNYKSGYHQGIDIVALENKRVYSIVEGIVSYAGFENINNKSQGFGLYVSIKYDETNDGFKKVFFGHLSECKVSKNEKVNNATIIGIMGSTGFSTGSHTHVEIRQYDISGKLIKILNPAYYMGISNTCKIIDSKDYRIEINISNKYKIVTSSGVNLRKSYSINSTKLFVVKNNEEVEVIQLYQGNKWLWGKVSYKGKIGWLAIKRNDNSERYAVKVE